MQSVRFPRGAVGVCPICGPTVFVVRDPWLRDRYVCARCRSVPRMRAIVQVLKENIPGWRELAVFEMAPAGAASKFIARTASRYEQAQYFDGVASGEYVGGVRREDLQELTYADASFDLVVTQDVFEHVLEPDRAWAEVARVLRPGGYHLWTVPIHEGRQTLVRAVPGDDGKPELLLPADYHVDPLSDGALVIHEWGPDVIARADAVSGMTTTRFAQPSGLRGIRGEMHDVLLSRKPAAAATAGTGRWPVPTDRAIPAKRVPTEFIRYTCGHDDYDSYLQGGFEIASMFNLALKKHTDRVMSDFEVALDFGCGAGRVARFMDPKRLYGCDVNEAIVRFCQDSIPRGEFHQNALMPPLKFGSGMFDLVCSFSVFSHLRLDVEDAWLAELARVGASGCVYLLTVQGDWMIDQTLDAEADSARERGFYFREVHKRHNSKLDFPSYYESSYHTSSWIRQHWTGFFDVVDVIKGDDPTRYLSGNLAFAPGGDVPQLRPMGQDLVVAVKR